MIWHSVFGVQYFGVWNLVFWCFGFLVFGFWCLVFGVVCYLLFGVWCLVFRVRCWAFDFLSSNELIDVNLFSLVMSMVK